MEGLFLERAGRDQEAKRAGSYLKQLCHGPSLLLRYGCVLLLHHAQAADGQLKLDLDLSLPFISWQ